MVKENLKEGIDTISYALGINVIKNLEVSVPELNKVVFLKAIQTLLNGEKPLISTDSKDIEGILKPFFIEKEKKLIDKIKTEGENFLKEIKKKDQIIETKSGLLYEILKNSEGQSPKDVSVVKVHYHGTTPLGEVFDSSVDRGEAVEFPLNKVIKGWTEGLQLMSVGSKYKFYIPTDLAYGANPPNGGQGIIKAYMPLVFEVELLSISA